MLGACVACAGSSLVLGIACVYSAAPVIREPDASSNANSITDADSLPDATFDVCNFPPAPTSTAYHCDAAAPGTKGCFGIDPVTTVVYPLGCAILLPKPSGMHCGALGCTCSDKGGPDGGPDWVCPE